MAHAVTLRLLMTDGVPFAEILDGDGGVRLGRGRGRCLQHGSNHIGKGLLGLSEIPDTRRNEDDHVNHRDCEPRPVNTVLCAQQAPAETIYDSHHRIERVEEAKPLWNYAALEADWRDIKTKLDHEWDNETEITIPDHEGGDPQTHSER